MVGFDNNEVIRALEFAGVRHGSQYRKGTKTPYVTHLANVGMLLAKSGCDVDIVVAGILHDIVEDTPTTLEEVGQRFGAAVMELVAEASEKDKSLPWKQRKILYLEALRLSPPEKLFIPCADKLDNITFLLERLDQLGRGYLLNFNAPEAELKWFYMTAAEILVDRLSNSILAGMALLLLEKTNAAFNPPMPQEKALA